MSDLRFKTIFRSDTELLLEGFLVGRVQNEDAEVFSFEIESAEDIYGNPVPPIPRVMQGQIFTRDEIEFLERELLEHAREDEKVAKLKVLRVPFRGGKADAYCASIDLGYPGYFSHKTGACEPPIGPEIDVALLRDVETDETIPVEDLSEKDYDRLVDAVIDHVQAEDRGSDDGLWDAHDAGEL